MAFDNAIDRVSHNVDQTPPCIAKATAMLVFGLVNTMIITRTTTSASALMTARIVLLPTSHVSALKTTDVVAWSPTSRHLARSDVGVLTANTSGWRAATRFAQLFFAPIASVPPLCAPSLRPVWQDLCAVGSLGPVIDLYLSYSSFSYIKGVFQMTIYFGTETTIPGNGGRVLDDHGGDGMTVLCGWLLGVLVPVRIVATESWQ